jgi:hypothetical protein
MPTLQERKVKSAPEFLIIITSSFHFKESQGSCAIFVAAYLIIFSLSGWKQLGKWPNQNGTVEGIGNDRFFFWFIPIFNIFIIILKFF